jgi:hypothetical protein
MTMSDMDWFEVTDGPGLLQGDILLNCPVIRMATTPSWPITPNTDLSVQVQNANLVVMSQSCDLENAKVEEVLLAQLAAWPDLVKREVARGNEAMRGSRFRKLLIEGSIPGYSLLHKREEPPRLAWSVVDFHRLFTWPRAFVQRFAASIGSRLRLRSPYREHLAQAFARYFMRVGLPHDAKTFEKEGDVKV